MESNSESEVMFLRSLRPVVDFANYPGQIHKAERLLKIASTLYPKILTLIGL